MKRGKRIFSVILMAGAVLFLLGSLNITALSELSVSSPGGYPVFIACLGLIFAIWAMIEDRGKAGQEVQEKEYHKSVLNKDVMVIIGFMIFYLITIIFFHYTIATLLFVFLTIYYLKDREWKTAALVAFISTFMILLVFKYLFSVILP